MKLNFCYYSHIKIAVLRKFILMPMPLNNKTTFHTQVCNSQLWNVL